ncbi:GNAT superfamily N-acetyltransferase [Variovorax boronicumulans]|jgi:GNAT superfamily N-acetyltransferase|uniref:GNAT family N-acetyltransferase n=1 Tax=Variovorax boronicumulans TaxID=436515 RepID=UPI0027827100|nr:GNAT family N-acetyltransferase [Variovorax boronicumulans]MDQ0085500.1 GNAT superfamily N-acetyltransferase [Variovorax boronicumulans]
MYIEQAAPSEAATVAAVLNEAAQWLAADGRPLWSAADVGLERVQRDTDAGRYFIARENGDVAGVMRLDMEDPFFWPEIEPGSSAFVHKLAVRRAWAGRGVSTALLAFARERAFELGRRHLRLDCVADRAALRSLYERFGFLLHSEIQKGTSSFARYELPLDN